MRTVETVSIFSGLISTQLKQGVNENKLIIILAFLILIAAAAAGEQADPRRGPLLRQSIEIHTNDVVAFLGGADVAATQESGHLETLLAVAFHKFSPHFRNFGWEGATVFDRQPRDVGFPTQKTQLKKAGASIIFLQYGRTEALSGIKALADFKAGYEKLIEECLQQTPRLVLVAPPPFENGGALLPDLSDRNKNLSTFSGAISELARARHLGFVDLFSEFGIGTQRKARLTENGLQFTAQGHALIAHAFMRQIGLKTLADRAGEIYETGKWSNMDFERVRQEVIAKNRLWFNYWRPQNWAFLGGDRTTQPSSRDHRNPTIRWFPEEIERFVPLIQQAERRINELAEGVNK